jgi:hypothetical protein
MSHWFQCRYRRWVAKKFSAYAGTEAAQWLLVDEEMNGWFTPRYKSWTKSRYAPLEPVPGRGNGQWLK